MRSACLTISFFLMIFIAEGAYAQNQYYLPQVANGSIGGYIYKTTFVLFNNSDTDASVVLNLTDDNANPLTATIDRFGTNSQFVINLEAGTTGFLQTDGAGTGVVGAATVTANTPIGVSAIFTIYDSTGRYLTEAGVGSSDLLTDFILPVDSTGSFLTGLALFNPGPDTSISLTLQNTDGSQAGTMPLPLSSFNHTAHFIASPLDLFPAVSNFQGTLLVHSNSPIAAMVLRQYQTQPTICYTSLPVVPQSSAKLSLNFAQVANGSYGSIRFKTSFLIFNISASPANVTIALSKDDGSPLTVTIPGNGPGTGTNSRFNFPLAAGASVFLQTDGLGSGTSGAAILTSNVPVGASAVFTVLDSQGNFKTEAGVGDSPVMASLTIPVDISGGFDTGIALFNPGINSVPATLKLIGANGVIVDSTDRPLTPNRHLPIFVDQLFPGIANFRGSLAISAAGGVAATTLRQYGTGDTYTTLPTVLGAATGTAQITPMLSKTTTGINATPGDPDIAQSVNLAAGSLITGSVNGPGQLVTVIASAGGNNFYAGLVNPLTGNYGIVVPDGTYNLTAFYQPTQVQPPSTLAVTYVDPTPVQVVSSALRDMTLPPVTLYNVAGTVSGLNNLVSGASATIVFTSNTNMIQGQFPIDATGTYQGVLPAGSYNASVSVTPIQFQPLQNETLQLYNLGNLNVTGDGAAGDYAIPATARLTGAVSGGKPLLASLPQSTSINVNDTTLPAIPASSCCVPPAVSNATIDLSGQYQMILPQNRTVGFGVEIPFNLPSTGLPAEVYFTPNPSTLNLLGDSLFNFTIPPLSPPSVTIFGVVTDGAGHALPNVAVTASSQSISGAPGVSYSVTGTTDIYGRYSIWILSGTQYRLTFVPPGPKF
jgi:hypothetical protein